MKTTKTTTIKNSSMDIIGWLTDVQNKRETWENGSYKTSNAELYGILASCLDVYEQLLHSDKRGARQALTERVKQLGYKVTESTPLATKVIRYVFKTDRKRSHTYARVITCAHQAGIDAVRLSQWIVQSGGVEEVRRAATSGVSNAQRLENFVRFAETELSSKAPLASLRNPTAEIKPDAGGTRNFSLGLLRLETDGTCSIVYGINNGSLLKQVLARAGRELEEQMSNKATAQKNRDNAEMRAKAIEAAA